MIREQSSAVAISDDTGNREYLSSDRTGAASGAARERSAVSANSASEIGSRRTLDSPPGDVSNGVERETVIPLTTVTAPSLAPIISALVELQKQRVFCIKSQSRCDRSTESFIARFLGFRIELDAAERKAIFARAGAIRRRVEKEAICGMDARHVMPPDDQTKEADRSLKNQAEVLPGKRKKKGAGYAVPQRAAAIHQMPLVDEGQWNDNDPHIGAFDEETNGEDNLSSDVLAVCTPIILNSVQARQSWDVMRENVEKRMRKLAAELPPYAWMKTVAGFGDLGIAIIVGEAGDIGAYATKERLWKRLGLAVINGERQRKCADAELAKQHGYNPRRRAEIWTIADSMFKHQWDGDKDVNGKNPLKTKQPVVVPAHPVGPYGSAYARRKAHTEDRDNWSAARRDKDARRVMTKLLIENLHRVWHGKVPLQEAFSP